MERLKIVEQEFTDFKTSYLLLQKMLQNRDSAAVIDSLLLANRTEKIINLQAQLRATNEQNNLKDLQIDDLNKSLRRQKANTLKLACAGVVVVLLISLIK